MKKCFKCGETKPLEDFYKHPKMADGRVNKCKECNKADVISNRLKRKNYYDAYDRLRSTTEHRRDQKRAREARPEVKSRRSTYIRQYAHSEKQKEATTAVASAVKKGTIVKLPCFVCGNTKVEGHHPDYDRQLDVIWLCTKHHAEVHRDYNHEEDKLLMANTVKGSAWDFRKDLLSKGER